LPSRRIAFLADRDIRRIYLSATMRSEVDFCRAFGRRPSEKIELESDAGVGERLIVLSDRETLTDGRTKGVQDDRIATVLSANQKLLVSTSSYLSAAKYRALAIPPSVNEFTAKLDEFRKSKTSGAAFILVGRVDGIDLPHATCRVMLADSLPLGFSLSETFLYDVLEMRNSFSAKLSNRVTQLFERTNRGRNDYSGEVDFLALPPLLLIARSSEWARADCNSCDSSPLHTEAAPNIHQRYSFAERLYRQVCEGY
jgi:hypothetical protein